MNQGGLYGTERIWCPGKVPGLVAVPLRRSSPRSSFRHIRVQANSSNQTYVRSKVDSSLRCNKLKMMDELGAVEVTRHGQVGVALLPQTVRCADIEPPSDALESILCGGGKVAPLGDSALLRLRSVPTQMSAAGRPVVSIFAKVTRSIIRSTIVPTAEGLRASMMRLPSGCPRMTRSSIIGGR